MGMYLPLGTWLSLIKVNRDGKLFTEYIPAKSIGYLAFLP